MTAGEGIGTRCRVRRGGGRPPVRSSLPSAEPGAYPLPSGAGRGTVGPGVPEEVTGHGKTGNGLTDGACHTPLASTQLATSLQGRDSNSILQRELRLRKGTSLAQGHTQQGRIMGSQVRLTRLKLLPVNLTGSGGDRDRGGWGVPSRELV